MKLLHDTSTGIAPGYYNVKMDMSSGDARLQWKIGREGYQDVPDSIKTSSDGFSIDLPPCRIKALITGDATVYVSLIRR